MAEGDDKLKRENPLTFRVFEKISDNIEKIARASSLGGGGAHDRSSSSTRTDKPRSKSDDIEEKIVRDRIKRRQRTDKKEEEINRNSRKSLLEVAAKSLAASSALARLQKSAADVSDAQIEQIEALGDLNKSMLQHEHLTNRRQDKLTDALISNINSTFKDLLSKDTADKAVGDRMRDIADKMLDVEAVQKQIVFAKKILGKTFENFDDTVDSHLDAAFETIDKFQQSGMITAEKADQLLDMVVNKDIRGFSNAVNKISDDADKLAKTISRTIVSNNIINGAEQRAMRYLGMFEFSVAAFVGVLASVTKDIWGIERSLHENQLGGELLNVTKSAIQYGVSIQSVIDAMANNKNILAKINVKQFQDIMQTSQNEMRKFGISLEDAYKSSGQFIENIRNLGVDVKDQKSMTDALAVQTKMFKQLSATTKISAEEFAGLQDTIIGNNEQQHVLYGMGVKERKARVESMMQMFVNTATLGGLNLAQAKQLEQAKQQLSGSKAKDRFTDAARIMQMSSILGMQGGEEIAAIHRKGERASPEEKHRLALFMAEMEKRRAATKTGEYSQEFAFDTLNESLSAPLQAIMNEARNLGLAQQNKKTLTPEEQKEAEKKGEASPFYQFVDKAVGSLTSFFNSWLGKLLVAVGLLTAGIVASGKMMAGVSGALGLVSKTNTLLTSAVNRLIIAISKGTIGGGGGSDGIDPEDIPDGSDEEKRKKRNRPSRPSRPGGGGGKWGRVKDWASKSGELAKTLISSDALKATGRIAGKLAGPLSAAADVGFGINDLVEGKTQKELSGLDYINPMRIGMWGGEKVREASNAGTGGTFDNITDTIFDIFTGNNVSGNNPGVFDTLKTLSQYTPGGLAATAYNNYSSIAPTQSKADSLSTSAKELAKPAPTTITSEPAPAVSSLASSSITGSQFDEMVKQQALMTDYMRQMLGINKDDYNLRQGYINTQRLRSFGSPNIPSDQQAKSV